MADRTDREIVEAVTQAKGLVSVAARSLGISRRTIYNRRKKSRAIREAIEEAREYTSDVAENELFRAIQRGEAWAVCFYLKCQAKNRGYTERQEHAHTGDVVLRVVYDDD